jgi:hypothetical protein
MLATQTKEEEEEEEERPFKMVRQITLLPA